MISDEDEGEISPEKSFIAPYPKWESKSVRKFNQKLLTYTRPAGYMYILIIRETIGCT